MPTDAIPHPRARRITFTGELAGADLFAGLFKTLEALQLVRFTVIDDPNGSPYAVRFGTFLGEVEGGGEAVNLGTLFNYKETLRPFLLTLAAQQDDPAIGQPGHNAKGAYEVHRGDVLRAGAVVVRLD